MTTRTQVVISDALASGFIPDIVTVNMLSREKSHVSVTDLLCRGRVHRQCPEGQVAGETVEVMVRVNPALLPLTGSCSLVAVSPALLALVPTEEGREQQQQYEMEMAVADVPETIPVYALPALQSLLLTPTTGWTAIERARVTCVLDAHLSGCVMCPHCPVRVPLSSANSYTLTHSLDECPARVTAETATYFREECYPAWASTDFHDYVLALRTGPPHDLIHGYVESLGRGRLPGSRARLLVEGPSGAGKTSLVVGTVLEARAVVAKSNSRADENERVPVHSEQSPRLVTVCCRAIATRSFPAALALLRERIQLAARLAPSILLLDALDALLPSGEPSAGGDGGVVAYSESDRDGGIAIFTELEHCLIGELGTIEGLSGRGVMLVGTCTVANDLPDEVRSMFTDCVHVSAPSPQERLRAARHVRRSLRLGTSMWRTHREGIGQEENVPGDDNSHDGDMKAYLASLVANTAGLPFVAMMVTMAQRLGKAMDTSGHQDTSMRHNSSPERASTVSAHVGSGWVSGKQVLYGHLAVKQQVEEMLTWAQTHANVLRRFNVVPPVGVLLYGPPGTGKTLFARALSEQRGRAFLSVPLAKVVRGEVGVGEQALWETFAEAKRRAPSTIFIDEFQAAFTARGAGADGGSEESTDRATGALLTAALASCMDDIGRWNEVAGGQSSVILLAATNEPWAVDGGFMRPGRLDRILYVGTLDADARRRFLVDGMAARRETAIKADTADSHGVEELVERTNGFTGADLDLLFQRSCLNMLRFPQSPIDDDDDDDDDGGGGDDDGGGGGNLSWSHLADVLAKDGVCASVPKDLEYTYHRWHDAQL